jgi:hypothetical protein
MRRQTPGQPQDRWHRLIVPACVPLAALIAACDGQIGDTGTSFPARSGSTASLDSDAATPTTAGLSRALRRLSAREYNNVVHDLLGDTTQPANQFGPEVYTNGFDNGSDSLSVQGADVLAFQSAAESLAATAVASNLRALIGTCDPGQSAQTCVTAFLDGFAAKAYRRPLTITERARLQTVYAAAATPGFTGGLQLMVEALLQSPSFLYREELGAPDPSLPKGVVRLTDYEVASELSFLLTGSSPDATLLAAAQGGTLKTVDDIRREATRLLGSAQARPALRSFLHQWMATDQVATINKDATVYPDFSPALATSMARELDQYFDLVLWSGAGSLRELLTSPQSFLDGNLATVYGVATPGNAAQPVMLDAQTRQGILTRSGFLAVHSDVDSSGPVPRGVFVLNSLICRPPSPPPANVPAAPPVADAIAAHETTRQRFGMHLNQPFCNSCHASIDGVGFGLEEFDGMGVHRTTENGSPVDPSGDLQGTDVDGAFTGVSQLAAKLVGSKEMLGCYIKQAYRYAMGQEESASSQAVLAAMEAGFGVDSRMTDALMALVADPTFVQRTTEQAAP